MEGYLIATFIFLFGLVVGSFLNAVIYRLGKGESAFHGRSYCPQCRHQLSWRDLIPVLSFVFLRGKCRYCKKPISWQYPLVEILTGAIFLLMTKSQIPMTNQIVNPNFQTLTFLYLFAIASALIIIFVYDLKYYLIPNIVLYFGIALVSFYRVFEFLSLVHWDLIGNWSLVIRNLGSLENSLLSAFFAALFFLTIYLVSRGKWLGFGDVKLAFFMGLFLGFPNILVALYSAFFAGAVVGIVLIAARKKKMNSQVPFGPFLVGGTFFALFFGQAVAGWYLRFFLV